MNALQSPSNSIVKNSAPTQDNVAVLNAIIILARTYATAKKFPNQYAKYGYDFPEMIKAKVMKLYEINSNSPWFNTVFDSLMNSMDSPEAIIDICIQLREMNRESEQFVKLKEYANVPKSQTTKTFFQDQV